MHLNRIEHARASALRRCGVLALALAGLACAEKPTLAVLPVKTADATAEEASLFRSELEKTFRANPDVRYIDVSSGLLEEIGASNGCNDAECAIQAGRVLDADHVVSPIVSKDGENWMMTLRLVDARSGEVTVSKAGLSGSSAAAAATDFSAALTEPMVAALHVAAPAVAAAPVFAAPAPAPVYAAPAPEPAPAAEPTYAASTPAPAPEKAPEPAYTPAPAVDATASTEPPVEEERSSASERKTKIAIWTGAGLLVAGGIAAVVVLMSGESSTPAPAATTPGGGTNNDNTMSVTVKWN